MRKRQTARPRLESMEQRLTLSALGAPAPTAEVHVTRLTKLEARKAHETAVHSTKHDATTKHHAKTTKSSSTSTSFSSAVSSFFKSALGGL